MRPENLLEARGRWVASPVYDRQGDVEVFKHGLGALLQLGR